MNLLERCQTANAKIAALVEAKKSKEIADNIRKRAADLKNASETMVDYSGRANVLLDAGILKPNELADGSKLTHQLTEMRNKLSEDPSAITAGRNFSYLTKATEKFGEQTEKVVNDQWKQHVSEIAPKIDNKLLAHHRNTSFAAVVANLETNAKEAKKLARTAPVDAEVFAQLVGYWHEIRTNLARIPQADDPEVQAFLNAVGSEEGAGLETLKESVFAWLHENKMIDEFCIRKKR